MTAAATDQDALTLHPVAAGAMASRTSAVVRDWIEGGTPPDEIAVLARVNAALLPAQVVLGEAGVPTNAPLDATVLGRTGIRSALAYLRLGLDPDRIRREDVFDTINRPARKVKTAVQPFLKRRSKLSMNQLQDVLSMLDGLQAERFEGYLEDLQVLTDAITEGADTERCLAIIRNRIGLGEAMDALDSSRGRPEGSSHGDDLDALEQLAHLHPDPVTFREWLVDRLREPGDPDGVTLSTVHRVKGMEWDRVVVFAANAGLLPHRLATDVEEERRVFHVAVTRCREAVAVVGNRDALSPFLAQLERPAQERGAAGRGRGDGLPGAVEPRTDGDGGVVAERGLRVALPGGVEGVVTAVEDGAATVALAVGGPHDAGGDDRAAVRVALGTPVTAGGRSGPLAAPPRTTPVRGRLPLDGEPGDDGGEDGEAPLSGAEQQLFDQLRDWRARTAIDRGVPAYVVLHDAHLEGIARARPGSLRELARCPGIGPSRLEDYGDDLLAIVAET